MPLKHNNNEKEYQNVSVGELKTIAYPKTDNPYLSNDDNNVVLINDEYDLVPFAYKTNIIEQPEKKLEQTYYTGLTYSDGSKQPNLSFKATTEDIIKFVWDGENVKINSLKAFLGVEHDSNCPYSLAYERETIIPNTYEFVKKNIEKQ